MADDEFAAQGIIVNGDSTATPPTTGLAGAKAAATLAKGTATTRKSNADSDKGSKEGVWNAKWSAACGTGDACVGVSKDKCLCGTAGDIATGLSDLGGLRTANTEATGELTTALNELTSAEGEVTTAMTALKDAQADELAEIVKCKAAKYDKYKETLRIALGKRAEDIALIEKLLDDNTPAKRGKENSRCEKAMSNGTFRPARGETTCEEGLCCGAARIPDGNIMMTIETCQKEDATTYNYRPPRAPMSTTLP